MLAAHRFRFLSALSLITLAACGSSSDGGSTGPSTTTTVATEVNAAKAFYRANGATLRTRVYRDTADLLNRHEAYVTKIWERGGGLSYLSDFTSSTFAVTRGWRINATGDVQNGATLGGQFLNAGNQNELTATNDVLSVNYVGPVSPVGYGNTGGTLHNHTAGRLQITAMPSSVGGYMQVLGGGTFILSMGQNSNTGRASLYTLIPGATPAQDRWTNTIVTAIDSLGINMTNDVSKAGTTDRAFWAWTTYKSSPDAGRLCLTNFNGQVFGAVVCKAIGVVGSGLSYESKHTVTIVANPVTPANPYVVVHRFSSNILDIYRFTGTDFASVATGVSLPTTLPASGGLYAFPQFVFAGSTGYVASGLDNKLYKLSGNAFVPAADALIGSNRVSAIEGTPAGLLLAVASLQPGTVVRIASDIVFLPN